MAQSGPVHPGKTDTDSRDCSPTSPLRLAPDGVQGVAVPLPRLTVELAPSRGFDPSAEEILRWSIALATTHRPFHHEWFSIHLRAHEGKLTYLLSGPSAILPSLCQRVPPGLTLREPPTVPLLALMESATASVTLPRFARKVPTDPDPLGDFARILADVDAEEFAEVVINLTPTRGSAPSRSDAKGGSGLSFGDLLSVAVTAAPAKGSSGSGSRGVSEAEREGLAFRICVHSHAFAAARSRARQLSLSLLSPLHAWGSVSLSHEGSAGNPSDVAHRPRERASRVLPQSVLAGLLLPATTSCAAPNVVRTPASAPVPAGVPSLGPGVWPLGTPEGFSAPIGVPIREYLFGIHLGAPEFGKTSMAMTQFLSQTSSPLGKDEEPAAGGAFVDPHRDAIRRLLPYYWQHPERVLFSDMGGQWDSMSTPVYNPIDCRGVSPQEARRRVSAVVGGLSVAAGWDSKATRSLPIATKCVQLLVAVARGLGPHDPVPTIHQIPMVCMDLDARKAILRDERVPNSLRRWWENEGTAYKPADFGPVTQIMSRLGDQVPLAAFMGGRSTFTPREAMDAKMVMLFGGLMSGSDEEDKLAVATYVRMLIQGAYSRADVPEEIRPQVCPPFYAMIDELPTCDGADLPKIFMELRKFLFRCQVMAVTPEALRRPTWSAAVTAASIITTTSLNGAGANMLATLGLWKDFDPRDLGEIEKYHHLTSITFQGRKHPPIAIKGMQPGDIFEARPGVVEASIPHNPRYRRVSDIMEELEDLDERLLAAWTGEGPKRSGVVSVTM